MFCHFLYFSYLCRMKQFISLFLPIIVCLFIAVEAKAQDMTVTDFQLDQTDLTAMQEGTKVLDPNGEKCAVIKIMTKETGFSFDVGSLGVMKSVNKVGEIWVYVPYGVKKISLNHPAFNPLKYNIPITIDKGRTYRMVLKVDKQTNTLTIRYSPINAVVMIDDEMVTGNNGVATKELPFGEHRYKVLANGYLPVEGIAKIKKEEPTTVGAQLMSDGTAPVQPSYVTTGSNRPSVPTIQEHGHDAVDLGLSVKWATCNIGASSPEDYGDYYAWGETEIKGDYKNKTYFDPKQEKYHKKLKTVLDSEDDVAHVKWGGSWRMPTVDEFKELEEKCTWTWTTQSGKKGYLVTSKTNGNSIFLPAARFSSSSSVLSSLGGPAADGSYWSSSLSADLSSTARSLLFFSSNLRMYRTYRHFGLSVRAVCP